MVSEAAPPGFLTTNLDKAVNWVRTQSMWPVLSRSTPPSTASCLQSVPLSTRMTASEPDQLPG